MISAGRCGASWIALASLACSCGKGKPLPRAGFVDAPVAPVASQVAGQVAVIPVHEGDRVKRGQLLAQLDSREREALVLQAEANVDRAREDLAEAEQNVRATAPTVAGAGADVQRAQVTLQHARQTFERTQHLEESNAATVEQLENDRAAMLVAEANLDALLASKAANRGKLHSAMVGVNQAQAALASSEAALGLARVQLAQAQVLAPFDGLVVERNLEPGDWAAPGTPVVTVEELSHPWVRLDVEETDLDKLAVGAPASIRVLAIPSRRFRGHVIEVGAEGDFAINRDVKRGRPDIRTFRVRVAVDEPDAALRPGMTVEVTLPPGAARPAASPVGAQSRQ